MCQVLCQTEELQGKSDTVPDKELIVQCEIDKNQMRTALHEKYLDRRFPGVLPRVLGKGTTLETVGKVILEPS